MTKAFQSMHYMMLAHSKAVLAYKKGDYKGKIGIVQSLEYKYPYNEIVSSLKGPFVKKQENEEILNNSQIISSHYF